MRLKIGVSACLLVEKCNFDCKDLLSAFVENLSRNPQIEFIRFCPEDSVFGTRRPNLRIVGGDGESVLDGKATIIDENGINVTVKQIKAAEKF